MACDHYKVWKFQIHWKQLKYVIPVKRDTKNNPFCKSSEKLSLKGWNFDNGWVGHSVMKPVDVELFYKKKRHQRRRWGEKNDFDTEILEEGALEKALNVENNNQDEKNMENIYTR